MKKMSLIIVFVILVIFLPQHSFPYTITTDLGWSFGWDSYGWDGNQYAWDGGEYFGGPYKTDLYLYVEPSDIYTDNKALVTFNLILEDDYFASAQNATGIDLNFYFDHFLNYVSNGAHPLWDYTTNAQIGTTNYTDFYSLSRINMSVPIVVDTGVPYLIATSGGWGISGGINYVLPPQIIDPNDGEADFRFGNGVSMSITSYDVNPVPEPSTLLILGGGLVGLIGFGRKKFRK